MDNIKIQKAFKYGSKAQKSQLEKLFSQVNSILDVIPAVNERPISKLSSDMVKMNDKSDRYTNGVHPTIRENQLFYSSQQTDGSMAKNDVCKTCINEHSSEHHILIDTEADNAVNERPTSKLSSELVKMNQKSDTSSGVHRTIRENQLIYSSQETDMAKSEVYNSCISEHPSEHPILIDTETDNGDDGNSKAQKKAKNFNKAAFDHRKPTEDKEYILSESERGANYSSSESFNDLTTSCTSDVAPLNLCTKSLGGKFKPFQSRQQSLTEGADSDDHGNNFDPMKEDDEMINLPKLRQPLEKGWRRETLIYEFTRTYDINGEVCYYAPGSQQKLLSMGQIKTILDQESSLFTIANFSFSTQVIAGSYLQPFGDTYMRREEAEMAKRLDFLKIMKLRNGDSANVEKDKSHKETSNASSKASTKIATASVIDADSDSDLDERSSLAARNEKLQNQNFDPVSESNFESQSDSEVSKYGIESEPESNDQNLTDEEFIKLKKCGSQHRNYYDKNGFLYTLRNRKSDNKHLYLRCKNKTKFKCHASAISKNKDLGRTILKVKHSHEGYQADVDKDKFKYKLDKNIRRDPFKLGREVYLKTMENMSDDIEFTHIPDKKEVSSFIFRCKKKFVPKRPSTVEEFEEIIENEEYKKKYTNDRRKQQFYRGTWKSSKGGSNIAFISSTILSMILTLSMISMRMDGTFKCLPRHLKFRQLFIISVIFLDRSYPLAYILMEKKSYKAYDLVFKNLKTFLPGHLVTEIMSDYECATRKAVRKHFPDANLVGCWFHYVQAVNRVAKRFGLSKDQKFSEVIRYISGLALLPNNYIKDGFSVIDALITRKSQRWSRFKAYWERQWMKANISVYKIVNRTNNYAESLNNSLNVLIGARHPNIWKLIDRIISLDLDYSNQIIKADKGKMFPQPQSQITIDRDTQIKNATTEFEKKKDVTRFLKNATFDIRLDLILKERLNPNDEISDEDFDEIIPNNFHPETYLVRETSKRKRGGHADQGEEKTNKKKKRMSNSQKTNM